MPLEENSNNFNYPSSQKQINSILEENKRLKSAIEELSILNEIAIAISSTLELDQIVELIIKKCVKHLHMEQGAVLLLDENNPQAQFQTMVRKADSATQQLPYRLDAQITGWMLKNRKPLLSNDLKSDDRFAVDKSNLQIKSILAVPLILKGKMIGVITGFNKKTEESFSDNDLRLISIIATQSAQVIENARLYKEEQQLQKMQQEMAVAKEIQKKLLPETFPEIPGYEIYGINLPAQEVGGDYFDFFRLNENKLAFCVADVSGKGIPAALVMCNLQAILRSQAHYAPSVADCVRRSNRILFENTDTQKYATLFYGVLDTSSGSISFASAGHNPPIFYSKNGQFQRLKSAGIVLGFLEEFDFSENTVIIEPGDLLVLYSDGISEAMNEAEVEFGEENIEEIIRRESTLPAKEIITKIIEGAQEHAGKAPQFDDMTLVIIKRVK